MLRYSLILSLVFLAGCAHTGPREAQDKRPLLHWTFDEGDGATTRDVSRNGLDGAMQAAWGPSPSGHAVIMDGTPQKIVTLQVPEGQRFGKDSWTFMALVKPLEFSIDDPQNQRRLFAFGVYPEAYLVVDLSGRGALMCYFCYKDATGKTVAAGGAATVPLAKGMWGHVAVVCDRAKREISLYVNGYSSEAIAMRQDFDGDYVLGGVLTIGSAWHNYWGLVDEVKVYRSALSKADVATEFERLKGPFAIVESEAALAAKRRAELARSFDGVSAAWAERDFARVRALCEEIANAEDMPEHFRSYAHLRIAQSHAAQKAPSKAKAVYEEIAANPTYPKVHRDEARECASEIERVQAGLPARDPSASRTGVPRIDRFAAEFYVATDGDDANDGSANSAFATLARARDAVRTWRAGKATGPVAVTVRPGQYEVRAPLALAAEDSGTDAGPVVYRAEVQGTSVFYGGARLSGFQPVLDPAILSLLPEEARDRVLQCDLKALGIGDYGELKVRGFGQSPSPPTLELYVDGVPMTLARWPNQGFVGVRKLVEPGAKAEGVPAVFEYDSDRHERWLQAKDAWLFGYFRYLWADATIKVGAIDPATRTLTTAEPYHYGGGMDTRQGIQYYAFNMLEEIDMPGEWRLDRDTGVLYLYPPYDLDKASVEIGMLSTPMITMDKVSHVRLEGLVLDLARYNGIVATDAEHCLIAGCTVSRMAGNGITIRGGRRNSLVGCDIHTIGRRATEVIGGDRKTLTPGEHLVENCRIHFFGRIDRTYTPAIQLEGVGNRVAHNLMYNCPSSVMRIEGNDHLIEFNEVHSAVQESDDQGAMELYRNATYRGVVFRHNYYHHIGKTGKGTAVHGQAGIRLDDAISGVLIYGNVFRRSANGHFGGVQMNSGRDNIIDNNIFIDCKQGISGGWNPGNSVWRMLRDGKKPHGFYMDDLYCTRYPQIKTMLDKPGINHVWRNLFHRCGKAATRRSNLDLFQNSVFEKGNPGFVNVRKTDFRLKPRAKVFQQAGIRPIPVEEIGLYEDRFRASWPVRTTPAEVPDWRKTDK